MKLSNEQDAILWQLQRADYLGEGQSLHRLVSAVFGWNVYCTKDAVKKALQSLKRKDLVMYFSVPGVWAVTYDGRAFECTSDGKVHDDRSTHHMSRSGKGKA